MARKVQSTGRYQRVLSGTSACLATEVPWVGIVREEWVLTGEGGRRKGGWLQVDLGRFKYPRVVRLGSKNLRSTWYLIYFLYSFEAQRPKQSKNSLKQAAALQACSSLTFRSTRAVIAYSVLNLTLITYISGTKSE